MVGWQQQVKGHEFEQTPEDSGGQRSLACPQPMVMQRVRCDLVTEQQEPLVITSASLLSVKITVISNSLRPHGLYRPWKSPGQNTAVGSLSLLQGIFPTQGSNPGPLHCMWILYQLSHQGSPVS